MLLICVNPWGENMSEKDCERCGKPAYFNVRAIGTAISFYLCKACMKKKDVGEWTRETVKAKMALRDSPNKVVFTEAERKVLANILEYDWIRRDIGMASKDEVQDKDVLTSAIKKLARLIELAKEKGILEYAQK